MSACSDIVTLERDGPVAILSMRSPAHSQDPGSAVLAALADKLRDLNAEGEGCRAVVLTGVDGHFCASTERRAREEPAPPFSNCPRSPSDDVLHVLVEGPLPVVAAVTGRAAGAGLAIVAACDYAVAAEDAMFDPCFVRQGLVPDSGVLWSLSQKIGGGKVREAILHAAPFDGRRALELGLANRCVARDAVRAAAIETAARLARLAPLAVALLKRSLAGGCDTLDQTFETEIGLQPLLRVSADHLEAVAAFLEKRKPVFHGR